MTESTRSMLVQLSSCAAALVFGGVCSYRIIRRQYINEKVAELLKPQSTPGTEALHRQLHAIRGTVNDTHKRVNAISKGLKLAPR